MNIKEVEPSVISTLANYYHCIYLFKIDLVTLLSEKTNKINNKINMNNINEYITPSTEIVNFVFNEIRSTMNVIPDPVL